MNDRQLELMLMYIILITVLFVEDYWTEWAWTLQALGFIKLHQEFFRSAHTTRHCIKINKYLIHQVVANRRDIKMASSSSSSYNVDDEVLAPYANLGYFK